MNLYTIVTNDKYEFPVKSDLRFGEVVEFLGMSKTNVKNMIYKPRKKAKYKILITGKTRFDQNAYSKKYLLTHDRSEYFRKYYRERVKTAKADLEEIQRYRALGTVEEIEPYIRLAEKLNVCDLVRENAIVYNKLKFMEKELREARKKADTNGTPSYKSKTC